MATTHQVQLSAELYRQAEERAKSSGFPSVDAYIADIVAQEMVEDAEDLDHLFTPERLATIDRASVQLESGQSLTLDEVRSHLRTTRNNWLRDSGK